MWKEERVHYNKKYLEREAQHLAIHQQSTLKPEPAAPIKPKLEYCRHTLTEAYRELSMAAKQNKELTTAAEWLIDNFYILQEQFVQLEEDLPPSYYKKMPRLQNGEYQGYPRIFELVQLLTTLSDSVIDKDITTIAVQAYQQTENLKLGELWGIPIMIRLVLLLQLSRKVEQLLEHRRMRVKIDNRLAGLLDQGVEEPGFILRNLNEIVRDERDDQRFLCMLANRMQVHGILTDTERNWFDYKFRRWDTSLEDELRYETQRTSRMHLSIQNAIASIRGVAENDWSDFVEDCSVVERILRLDPAGFYPNMNFATRDRYRKVVEGLANRSATHSEPDVAQQVLLLAEQAESESVGTSLKVKARHVGYYLIDVGYQKLASDVKYRMPIMERVRRWSEHHASVYFGLICMHLLALLSVVGVMTGVMGAVFWIVALTFTASFFPALELAIASTNRILLFILPPRILPKLKITGDVRDEFRTLVVVPTLFTSPEDVRSQFENLEIRSLANPNRSLQFALLSDFTDADSVHRPGDNEILEAARHEVARLNRRYNSNYGDKFYLLHRRRVWNTVQQKWMGWERKRGKLEELNLLLRKPGADTTFTTISGDFLSSIPEPKVRYVITLDADTQLPPGSALELISTAGHPLNRAEVSPEGSKVIRGYGIFQPRVSITPKTADKTPFAGIFSGNVGIDPYTTAVSDIYQDLFGEAVFTGKGLYDVDTFSQVLGKRFPENTVLSHDLLESTYLRTALLTDIEVFDDYPRTYLSYVKRNHRWIRGDWQIFYWLLAQVPSRNDGRREPNPINIVSKWKIFDNLRRSLNPAFLILFLLTGWFLLPGSAFIWTAAALGVVAFPIYSSFTTEIFQRPTRVKWKLYLEKIRSNIRVNTTQAVLTFLFMPHMAYLGLDAVVRTIWRMLVSHKNLLEWTAASLAEREARVSGTYYLQRMWFNIAWSMVCIAVVVLFSPSALYVVVPMAIGWMIAPVVASELGKKADRNEQPLNDRMREELREYARRTWHYFEQYVNEEHAWLAPDNFQEEPYIGAVARTSPTNMGLALSATAAAYEFGYLSTDQLLYRLGNMLGSMRMLDKYCGHFFNWYSTKNREVLKPQYISTVDSGNLAASLITIKQMLQGLKWHSWPNAKYWDGLKDTCRVIKAVVAEADDRNKKVKGLQERVSALTDAIESHIPVTSPDTISRWLETLDELKVQAEKVSRLDLSAFKNEMAEVDFHILKDWMQRPFMQVQYQQEELEQVLKQQKQPGFEVTGLPVQHLQSVSGREPFQGWLQRAEELAGWCDDMVTSMDFTLLYLNDKDLFSIGYNLDRAALDDSTYDQLATEARLASFIAIAKGDVPPKHWFRLSRRLTSIQRNEILLSWGGTMFEYLMPLIFMSRTESTLLDHTYDNVVAWQQNYGKSRGKPWGYSESGYGVLNLELHYQYRAFGAPGLGLKRGLAEDYVVSPYASMLSLMVRPEEGRQNLQRLRDEGAYGMLGFYEAIDYSSSNGKSNGEKTIVQMYMAHHQAMSLLALANVLEGNIIQKLFHQDPMIKACEVLLQERVPRGIPIKEPRPIDVELEPGEEQAVKLVVDHASKQMLDDPIPRTHILSNGHYTTVLTHAGTGFSFCDSIRMNRWRADRIQDPYGFFFYIKDCKTDTFWSMGHQPVGKKADRYDTWFHTGKMQTARVDDWIESFMEVCVSPEDNLELRKLTLTNYSQETRRVELTSYAEVVLNEAEADLAHPGFSNLFVQIDFIAEHHALVAKRRPRSAEEHPLWLIHTIASDDAEVLAEPLQFETDRRNFIGRGRSLKYPAAMDKNQRLSGLTGNVPDPIVSMRCVVELEPGKKKSVTFGLGKAENREEVIVMADRYDNTYATDRVFDLASIYGRVELDHIGLSGERAHYFQKLAGTVIYGNEQLRGDEDLITQNRRTQSGLWAYGISGDLPIILFYISNVDQLRTLDLLLKAHALWRLKGLEIDLVIVNDHPASYIDELQESIHSKIQASMERNRLNKRGGIFVVRSDNLTPEDLVLMNSVAAVVMKGKLPKLEPEDEERGEAGEIIYHPVITGNTAGDEPEDSSLLFFNGYGGFTREGREYVIHVRKDDESNRLRFPPAPWINVLSNPEFGCITSENGSDYTWSQNSRENRLTPWLNDAVTDPPGDVIYVRDDGTQRYWTPTPSPVGGASHYETRHGFGYTRYKSAVMDIHHLLTKWVPPDESIKIMKLQISNTGLLPKDLKIFRYLDWVLGVFREQHARHLITEYEASLNTVFARNFYNNEFAGRVAFASILTGEEPDLTGATADRGSFIGRNRSLANPIALETDTALNGRFGAGMDPCAAFQTDISLSSGESRVVLFLLGEASSEEEARRIVEKYRRKEELDRSFRDTDTHWKRKLGQIRIHTPAPEIDVLMNGWLQYQNIACRIWARSGFYQSGGAYGFRDQLQDVSAALYLDAALARRQILIHAAHQFPEGDVLHWWHPPTDRGTRTRISDDLLWLPYVTALYVKRTGDGAVLDEEVPFITTRPLEEGEHEAYLHPEPAGRTSSLFEHCCLAIDRSLPLGEHGLPLMGAGDWNDSMNRVGEEGKGESVWLGFFLYTVLSDFIPLCKKHNDDKRAKIYQAHRKKLKLHLNREGWDGKWYRRAFYDDGTPIGSSQSDECKIDAIAQAWSVISKVAPRAKAQQALQAAEEHLVSVSDGIIRLLTPPFDETSHNPGYIKGYISGVRENGGQYTHGALWLVRAIAEMGNGDRAVELMRMLNPIRHSIDKERADIYRVEPYAVAADIYGEPPLVGMGGWTWYTGSAGWMYRVVLESILGFNVRDGNKIFVDPVMPSCWDGFTISLHNYEDNTNIELHVVQDRNMGSSEVRVSLNGKTLKREKRKALFTLPNDGKSHQVTIRVGARE